MSLESVFGLLGGVLILGDQPTSRQIAGCAVILFAVIFSQLPLGDWLERVRHRPIHAAGENTPGNMVSGTAADSPVTTDAPSPDTAPATDVELPDGGDTGADK